MFATEGTLGPYQDKMEDPTTTRHSRRRGHKHNHALREIRTGIPMLITYTAQLSISVWHYFHIQNNFVNV